MLCCTPRSPMGQRLLAALLQGPAICFTAEGAGQLHPPSPVSVLGSPRASGAQGPSPYPPPPPACSPSPGHCHFSSRHWARPHLHCSPDGSPQPSFPELPATLVSVPRARVQAQRPLQGKGRPFPSQPGQSRVCRFGVRGDNWLEAESPPLPPSPAQDLERWLLLELVGGNCPPRPVAPHKLSTLPRPRVSPQAHPRPPLWEEEWAPQVGVRAVGQPSPRGAQESEKAG